MFMEYQFSLWIQRTVLKNTFSEANAWIALVIILVDVDTSSSNSISLQWRHNERDGVPNHRRFYATVCCNAENDSIWGRHNMVSRLDQALIDIFV